MGDGEVRLGGGAREITAFCGCVDSWLGTVRIQCSHGASLPAEPDQISRNDVFLSESKPWKAATAGPLEVPPWVLVLR